MFLDTIEIMGQAMMVEQRDIVSHIKCPDRSVTCPSAATTIREL
jgi:hypothetical protein